MAEATSEASVELPLRVRLPSKDDSETLVKLDASLTASEALVRIKHALKYDGSDVDLFRPEDPVRNVKAGWVPPEAVIGKVFIKELKGDEDYVFPIVLRVFYETYPVYLMDQETKVGDVPLDVHCAVSDLIPHVLKVAGFKSVNTLSTYYTLVSDTSTAVLDHLMDDEESNPDTRRILNRQASLYQSEVKPDQHRVVLIRYYFFNENTDTLDLNDPGELNAVYSQFVHDILHNFYWVEEEDAIELAGLLCHIQLGPYESSIHKEKHLKQQKRRWLPEIYSKKSKLFAQISKAHVANLGMAESDAKRRFVSIVQTKSKAYGNIMFHVKDMNNAAGLLALDSRHAMYLGSAGDIGVPKQKFALADCKRWAGGKSSFVVDFGNEKISFKTREGESISNLLSMYFVLKNAKGKSKTKEKISLG